MFQAFHVNSTAAVELYHQIFYLDVKYQFWSVLYSIIDA